MKKLRVAAYVRVSDESQVEGYSLEAQRAEISRWCERRGHELVKVYAEEGVSAHTEHIERRPELMRLLKDAGTGMFDLVAVHTLDRWARNVGVQRQALKRLGESNSGFVSVSEEIDFTTPSGRLMLTMIGGVAEFFSDQLGVHVRKGQQERARQGKSNGDLPFGYRRCREEEGCPTEGHPGGAHVVEAETEALRELFSRYAAGSWTQVQAANWLNLQGFRTRNKRDTGRGAGPQLFTGWSVREILTNPFYAGFVRWNRTETFKGQHEAIIDWVLFARCQAVRASNRLRSRTFARSTRPYLLKGLLRCASCAEPYWSERSGRKQSGYYRGARRGQDCPCQSRSFRTERIDAQVGLLVYSLTLPSDWIERSRANLAAAVPDRQVRKGVLEERRRRAARAFVDGGLSETEYSRELETIDHELAALDYGSIDESREAALLLDDLETLWREGQVDERARILWALFEAIYVDLHGRIVAIAPKPAMVPVFSSLSTNADCGVTLTPVSSTGAGVKPSPPHRPNETECLVGGVETGENRTSEMAPLGSAGRRS